MIRPDHRGPVDRPYRPFVDPAQATPIIQSLQELATRQGAAIAIEDGQTSLTFGGLMRAVAALTERLATAPRGLVAILPPAGAEYAVAVFAALAASRISVPLDASYPDGRNASIAAETGVTVVLVGGDQPAPDWPGVAALRVAVDVPAAAPAPASFMDLDAPAFILCTSGSTGRPKSIAHSQRTMLHWARTTHEALHVTSEDRALSLSSLSTLGGFTALLSFPLSGAAMQMLDLKTAGLGGLIETLERRPVSILRGTPSLLRALVAAPDAGAALRRLRAVQTYGEPLTRADHAEISAALPAECRFRNTYGSTEASGFSCYVDGPEAYHAFRVPAGHLMPDTVAAIRDEDGRPCRFGEPGELWVSSRYNALGEWHAGEVIPGPFEPDGDRPGSRIFRTGDVAVAHSDGVFVVLGRRDRMVKINGQRLEPAEIESALRQHPAVRQAQIVVRKRDNAAAALIGFVVAQRDAAPGMAVELREFLRDKLPGFMVPARIVLVAAMPLLPGGKVDEAALLALAERPRC